MLEQLTQTVEKLNDELASYKDNPTKASSKRIRLLLGSLKNQTPSYRADLVQRDKTSTTS